jgi:AraC-like DNA-binding protein
MRELVHASPDGVLMSRPVPEDVGAYRRCFGVTPRFLAEQYALVFPVSILERPVRGADRELRRILVKPVAEVWAVRRPSVTDSVIRILRARVLFADATLKGVAQDLSMHPQTLNRQLQAEGASFRDLRNQARFDVARELLAGTLIPVTDLALVLGYTEISAFTHAFRRWAGAAPSQWRGQLWGVMLEC